MQGANGMALAARETARLELARVRLDGGQTRDAAVRRAAKICAHALDVERVGVWMLDAYDLVSAAQYLRSTDSYTSGKRLLRAGCPAYIEALRERRVIAAHDARTDRATHELAAEYLVPLGITSMLDAPIYRRGEVVGVVCHEHVGPPRHWSQAEIDFAGSVADMLGMIFEQADNLLLEAELRGRAARIRDAERCTTLARMASSVAHDFNSVLTTIALISSSLTRHKEPAVAEQARTIAEAVVVGSHLVEHLSTMGRAGTLGETTADVAACVETLRRLMEPLVRDRASLVVSVSTPAPRVSIPALQLIQILMNLCLNAADAMSEMGTIEIQVRASTPDEAAESMAVIEVKDDGSGISAEIERDIFNPYFTTKEQGTGLGLAIVRDIVAEHGGRVVLHTRPGAGSTFLVMLPLAR